VANNIAYHDTATITAIKSFLVQAPETHDDENKLTLPLSLSLLGLLAKIKVLYLFLSA
jgi:hypothetical protein